MSDDTTTSSELATVAGELYGALLDARPIVAARAGVGEVTGSLEHPVRVHDILERIDAVLADAADYLEAVAL